MPETTRIRKWRGRKSQNWYVHIADCHHELHGSGCSAPAHFKCGPDAKWACREFVWEPVIPPTKKVLTDYFAVAMA